MARGKRLRRALCALAGLLPAEAQAGPPFVTDDPQPTDLRKWEIYVFAALQHEPGATAHSGGLDLNYGPLRDVQATVVLPLNHVPGARVVPGDVELAAKVKLLHQGSGGSPVDLAVFPRLFVPTAPGPHAARVLLPVWVQRSEGHWALFGGGGYMLNPGSGQRNYWQGGMVVTRDIGERVLLGVELYGQGADELGGRPLRGVNIGGAVKLGGPLSLLCSVGEGLNRPQTIAYTALKFDF